MIQHALATVFFALVLPAAVQAQRAVGIDWNIPNSQAETEAELEHFSELGISYLQVDQPLADATWNIIETQGFAVFGKLPVKFPVSQTFSEADSAFLAQLETRVSEFDQHASVKAISLFSYGPRNDADFDEEVGKFAKEVREITQKPFFYLTLQPEFNPVDSLFDFKMLAAQNPQLFAKPDIGAYLYKPDPVTKFELAPVKQFLERTTQQPQIPVFFESDWLNKIIDRHPDFAETLQLYASSSEPVFPLPNVQPQTENSANVIVLMLLLAWVLFAVTYNFNPVFRKSFLRYFTGHKFYVKDVMNRHIRSLFTGSSILIQHGFSAGILLYCVFSASFSASGFEALYYHFPWLTLFGTGKLGIFMIGFFFTILIEIISITWLRLTNPQVQHFGQIVNLYPWPLQLNLIVSTLAAGLLLAGGHAYLIYFLSFIFLLFFAASFIITAFDTGSYMAGNRYRFLAVTVGIYLVLLVILLGWVIFDPQFINTMQLAASFP